jgi:hypothetical protein
VEGGLAEATFGAQVNIVQMRRIAAVERLKDQMEKRVDKWQQYARRLERKAGPRVPNPAEGK